MTTFTEISDNPAISVCFKVNVDGHDLGAFTTCSGLGAEITVEDREEGGNPGFVHHLPGQLKFTNVRLTRPLGPRPDQILKWMTEASLVGRRTTAHIAACAPDGSEVASWTLDGVIPVRWTGPEMNVESPKVCTETLELAHHGFLFDDGASAAPAVATDVASVTIDIGASL